MMLTKTKAALKELVARSGLRPSYLIQNANGLLEFGQWLRSNGTGVTFGSRYEMYRYLADVIIKESPVDYLEFGVYKGDSIKYWSEINKHPMSRFFGFDSFEGLPEDWGETPRGTFDTSGVVPAICDSRVSFVKGYFQDTLPAFLNEFVCRSRLLIHCDADLFTSTLYVLCVLNRVMVPGTILVFDEFSSVTHEFRALRDYSQSFLRDYRLLASCSPFFGQVALDILK
jgi:O-methyltransferase